LRNWRAMTAMATAGLTSCATELPSIPNPRGVADDALTLDYVLDQGCIPYIRGQKSEQAAMEGVGMRKVAAWSFPDPPPPPHWIGRYPGVSAVNVTAKTCDIHVVGRHMAEYLKVTTTVLHDRLGADADRDAASTAYRRAVPGEVIGCAEGIRYTYNPSPPSQNPGWDVEVHRGC